MLSNETDPSGRSAHESGAKLDAGKPDIALVLGSFARALWEIAVLGTKGAIKYSPDGWLKVPNGINRYDSASLRHWLKEKMGEEIDPDMEVLHAVQTAWNSLARLELLLRQRDDQARLSGSVRRNPIDEDVHEEREDRGHQCRTLPDGQAVELLPSGSNVVQGIVRGFEFARCATSVPAERQPEEAAFEERIKGWVNDGRRTNSVYRP